MKTLRYVVQPVRYVVKLLCYVVKTLRYVVKLLRYVVKLLPYVVKSLRYVVKLLPYVVKLLRYVVKTLRYVVKTLRYVVKTLPYVVKLLHYVVKLLRYAVYSPLPATGFLPFKALPQGWPMVSPTFQGTQCVPDAHSGQRMPRHANVRSNIVPNNAPWADAPNELSTSRSWPQALVRPRLESTAGLIPFMVSNVVPTVCLSIAFSDEESMSACSTLHAP